MCQLLDRVYYSTQSPQRKCCYEDHDDTTGRTGNFMYCLPTTQADLLFGTDPGEGTCSTYSNGSKKGCGGLAPAKRKKKKWLMTKYIHSTVIFDANQILYLYVFIPFSKKISSTLFYESCILYNMYTLYIICMICISIFLT